MQLQELCITLIAALKFMQAWGFNLHIDTFSMQHFKLYADWKMC